MGQLFLELSNRGLNGPWRWLGGTAVIIFFWLVLGSIIALPFIAVGGFISGDFTEPDPFWLYLGGNLSFLGVWLGLFVVMRWIMRRPLNTLVTPFLKLNWRRMATGFLIWLALGIVAQTIEFLIYPDRAIVTFELTRWLVFLPFILIFTPLQTSAEELLFRGYWLQGTGRLTRVAAILIVVNGILFSLPHMLNPEVTNNPSSGVLLFLNYFLVGAAFALFTLRDNRLELALGAHLANNLFAALVVNYADSALTTPAIITTTTLDAKYGLIAVSITVVAFYLIVFRLLDRRAPYTKTPSPVEEGAGQN